MAVVFGYGVNLSELNISDEKALGYFISYYLPDQRESMEEDLSSGYSVFDWVKDYDSGLGYTGLSALLVEVIRDREDLPNLMTYDQIPNGCVYLPTAYPWCFNGREKQLTKENLETILRKYLLPRSL